MKYFISYSSSLITVANAVTVLWIIRLASTDGNNVEQLAELLFLIGLFPVITFGYPMWIVAEVSRSRILSRSIIYSAYRYLLISWLLISIILYIFFKDVWWISGAYPLVFVVSLLRGYFEAFEKFWFSAVSKLIISAILLLSASQLVIKEVRPDIFWIVCIGLSVITMLRFYKTSTSGKKTKFNVANYSIQAVFVLSFIFTDRLLMKFTADGNTYISYILMQETLYKIISLFMLMSVFHFSELNSDNESIKQKGLVAYKWQFLIACCSISIFIWSPLGNTFFQILGFNSHKVTFFMFPALLLPIMSMLLQKIILSQTSNGVISIFTYTIVGSTALGSATTYFLKDPVFTMATRGGIEVLILLLFIYRRTSSKRTH